MTIYEYKSQIPAGESGPWSVVKFTVSPKDEEFERLRALFGSKGRFVPAGDYTSLRRNGQIIMSDTPDEMRDCSKIIWRAKGGHVLINGLGLGCVVELLFLNDRKPPEQITVVEASPDVIALVAPTLLSKWGDRLTIVEADAFTHKPPKGVRYSAVWHDIWDAICKDNLPEITKLKRKYGRRCDWQGAWAEYEIRRYSR